MDIPTTYDSEIDLEKLFTSNNTSGQTQPTSNNTRGNQTPYKIKSHKKLSTTLVTKDKLNAETLNNMGFQKSSIGTDKDTRIIYPSNMKNGESLPVVILQGGDGADKNYYNNYFNNYRSVSGNDLPRAIYVLAPNYGNESKNNNAYQYAKGWMDSRNVSASQVGIETFSGGGGTGLMMANQAAEDNKNIPVTLLLMDAARDGVDGANRRGSKSFSEELERLAKNTNITVVGATKEFGGFLRDVANAAPDRTYKIKIKNGDYGSHSGVRSYALYYDFMLSLMGLSTKLSDNKSLFKFRGDNGDSDAKLNNGVALNDILSNIDEHAEELGTSTMDILETSSNLYALDEFMTSFNSDINALSSVESGNVAGNDLLSAESSLSSSLSTSVTSLTQKLAIDAVSIRGVGEDIENADKNLLSKMESLNSFNSTFNNYAINSNLIKERESIIKASTNEEKSGDKTKDKSKNKNNNHSSGYAGNYYNNLPTTKNESNVNPGTYLVGTTSDGGKVIASYNGTEITKLVIQYDMSKLDYIEQNKEEFLKIADSIKQFENENLIEITIKNEIFVNKDLESIKTVLNIN